MSENEQNIDPEVLIGFIDESLEILADLNSLFVELEKNPSDLAIIEAIFRPVHTVKGNATFFGCLRIKALAHEMETLLDLIRNGSLQISSPMIDALLRGGDELNLMLVRVRDGLPEVDDDAEVAAILAAIEDQSSRAGDDNAEVLAEIHAQMKEIEQGLEPDQDTLKALIASMIERVESIVPDSRAEGAGYNSAEPRLVGKIREILDVELDECLPDSQSQAVLGALQELLELEKGSEAESAIQGLLDDYETFTNSVGFDEILSDTILEKLDAVTEEGAWTSVEQADGEESSESAEEAELTAAPEDVPGPGSGTARDSAPEARSDHENTKTMRVAEANIDTFLEFVGELIVVGDMFTHLQTKIMESGIDGKAHIVRDFRRANETFGLLSTNLQRSIMAIRKVPVRALLHKAPRLARDIASAEGKQIEVELIGEDIEVDKSLIDILDGPLTHMVRNAADHGVEAPDVREAAGKSPQGKISVSVEVVDKDVVLKIADDGGGLDYEAIARKAEEMGLIKPGRSLNSEAIVNFIFSSGVSTAQEISDISGRGVGMDVVKRQIQIAGGRIDVTSEAGVGTEFSIQIPSSVTTQIMLGYLVRAGGRCYALPMERVYETARVDRDEIKTVVGTGRCIVRRGEILPVVSLGDVLGHDELETEEFEQVTLVTVASGDQRNAVEVDEVVGVQQIVLREIEGLESESEVIAGGALMGDGSVALIVDVEQAFLETEHV